MTLGQRIAYFALMAAGAVMFIIFAQIGAVMVSPFVQIASLGGEIVAVAGMFFAVLAEGRP